MDMNQEAEVSKLKLKTTHGHRASILCLFIESFLVFTFILLCLNALLYVLAGGGGGLIHNTSYDVHPGTIYSLTVGVGGLGATSNSETGKNGGNSVFGSLIGT